MKIIIVKNRSGKTIHQIYLKMLITWPCHYHSPDDGRKKHILLIYDWGPQVVSLPGWGYLGKKRLKTLALHTLFIKGSLVSGDGSTECRTTTTQKTLGAIQWFFAVQEKKREGAAHWNSLGRGFRTALFVQPFQCHSS